MPTVPLIERQVKTQPMPNPQLQQVSGFAQAAAQRAEVASPLMQGAQNLTSNLQQVAAKRQEEADTVQVMNADRELNGWINRYMFDPEKGALNRRGKDAIPLPEEFQTEYQKQYRTMFESLTPNQQQAFARMANQRQMTANEQLQRHVFQQMGEYRANSVNAYQQQQVTNASLYFNDTRLVEDAAMQARNAIMVTPEYLGADPYKQQEMVQKTEGPVLYAALAQMVNRDPRRALDYYEGIKTRLGPLAVDAEKVMKTLRQQQEANRIAKSVFSPGAPQNDTELVSFVMDNLEGGARVVQEPNGGVAKYGINSVANPEVDVRNLTREQAANIYMNKYMPAADAAVQSVLSPDGTPVAVPTALRTVAFDTIVNHGEGNGADLIAQSNGDVNKLLDLREAEYRRLAAQNPEKYGSSLTGWLNRLDTLRNQVNGPSVDATNQSDVLRYMQGASSSPEVSDLAFKAYNDMLKAQEETRKLNRQQLSDEIYRYQANGQTPPTDVIDKFRNNFPEDYLAWTRGSNGGDPQLIEQTRMRILSGDDVDLSGMRVRLGDQYDKLRELQTSPDKLDEALRIDQVVKRYQPAILNGQKATDANGAQAIDNFRRALTSELQTRIKTSGQQPTTKDIEGIAAMLSLDVGGWGANRIYDYGNDSNVMGVSLGGTYSVKGGRTMSGREIISAASVALSNQGTPVTYQNISDYVDALMKQGEIYAGGR